MSRDFTSLQKRCAPTDVLVCDSCNGPIHDIDRAMLFWEVDASDAVKAMYLAHKGPCDRRTLSLSAELFWFADRAVALEKLAGLALGYVWTGEQARRLALIAWAIPHLANPAQRRESREFARWWL